MSEKKKRVLLVTQYFYPENFKSNELAFELVKRGYEVDALVGIPNYPEGKYFKGYGIFKKRHEVVNGVNVYRCFQTPRGKGGWRLPVNYFSFVVFGCLRVLFHLAWKHYDCIIGHEPSPIFQAYPALLLRKIKKIPFYYWIMDLWPDAMMSGGGVKNKKILNFVDKLVKGIYNQSDKILITSKPFRRAINEKGDYDKKIVYYPNWSVDMSFDKLRNRSEESKEGNERLESLCSSIPALPEGFKIMIAGNLGSAQCLDKVAEVMMELKDVKEVKWVFVGDGSKKAWLDEYIKENGLEENAVTVGRFPAETMPLFFAQANAMLCTLKGGFRHLEMVVPARLQSYMSAGRPVLAMLGEGGAEIIEESGCGYVVPAGDSKALAQVIRKKVLTDKEGFEAMGAMGRKYYEENYMLDMCIDKLVRIIESGKYNK